MNEKDEIKTIEEKKKAILDQIADCDKAIDLALSFDSAALDPLTKLKADLNAQLKELDNQNDAQEEPAQEVPKDAPFCRVFLLTEVDQNDLKDEIDPWNCKCGDCSGVLYIKGTQDNTLRGEKQ